ncbi:hypothetical protein ACE6H2_005884 [Prunus campanulata]
MPAALPVTPPRAEQRSQERERIEPYGESSSLGIPAHTQALGYGQHSLPPTNSWGQSQPTWANPGPTYSAETARGPLHALAVSLGHSSLAHPAIHPLGPVHTAAVQTHPGPSNATAVSSQQYGQTNLTVSPPLQASLFPLGSHIHYSSAIPAATHAHLAHTHGAHLASTSAVIPAELPVPVAQQTRPQNEVQQVPRPCAVQQEAPPQGL